MSIDRWGTLDRSVCNAQQQKVRYDRDADENLTTSSNNRHTPFS